MHCHHCCNKYTCVQLERTHCYSLLPLENTSFSHCDLMAGTNAMSMWLYDIMCCLDIVEWTVMSILLMRISDQQVHALHVVCLSHIRIQLITSQQTAIFTAYIHISIQNNCTELSTPPSCHLSYSKFVTKIQRNNCLTDNSSIPQPTH